MLLAIGGVVAPGLIKAVDVVQQASASAAMPEWSNVVSPATILAILSNVVLAGVFLRKQGAKEALTDQALSECNAKVRAIRDDFEAAKGERDRWREGQAERYQTGRDEFRRTVEQSVAGVQASVVFLREQQSDFKIEAARTYVTRSELSDIEARNAAAFERVNDRLDNLSAQLQDVSAKILGAVERLHQTGRGH